MTNDKRVEAIARALAKTAGHQDPDAEVCLSYATRTVNLGTEPTCLKWGPLWEEYKPQAARFIIARDADDAFGKDQ